MAFESNCFGDKCSNFISSTILLLSVIGMFVLCFVYPYFGGVFVAFVALVVFIWNRTRIEADSTRCTHQSDGVSSTRDETRTSSVTQSIGSRNAEQVIEVPVKNPVDNPPLYDEVVQHCQLQSKADGLSEPPTYEEAVQNEHVGVHFVNVCFDSSESPDCT
jgi:hypothetical protein